MTTVDDTLQDTLQTLAEAEQRRMRLHLEEQQRINEENRRRRALEDADRAVIEARGNAREAVFENAIQRNTELVAANNATHQPLIDALNGLSQQITDAIKTHGTPIDRTFETQQQHARWAVQQAVEGQDFTAGLDKNDPRREWQADVSYFGELGRRNKALQPALPMIQVLIAWIAAAPDAATKQIRIGMVYAGMGQLFNPDKGYDARRVIRELTAPRRL